MNNLNIETHIISKPIFPLESHFNILQILNDAQRTYPGFYLWYTMKFLRGLAKGSRFIILKYLDKQIIAVALLKNDRVEKKICSIKVVDGYRHFGVGISLFEESMDLLQTDKPLITISENCIDQFLPILKYYNFTLEQTAKGFYQEGLVEYVFNGELAIPKRDKFHSSIIGTHLINSF